MVLNKRTGKLERFESDLKAASSGQLVVLFASGWALVLFDNIYFYNVVDIMTDEDTRSLQTTYAVVLGITSVNMVLMLIIQQVDCHQLLPGDISSRHCK